MSAQKDNPTPSSTTTWWRWGTPPRSGMRRLIAPWEYRHLHACARVRITAGIVLAGLGAVTLFGGSFTTKAVGFAALFLVAAAASFSFAAWELAIVRSAPPQT
jgi:hypothetical protein